MKLQTNYLLMDKEDLLEAGLKGYRIKLASVLMSSAYDITMIVLIVFYSLILGAYFIVEDLLKEENGDVSKAENRRHHNVEIVFIYIEMAILFLFCIDIAMHIVAYGMIYMRDCWNFFDVVVIFLNIGFVVLDLTIVDGLLKNFLKLRGLFRLLRIAILFRKLNTVKQKRDRRRRISMRAPTSMMEVLTP